MVPSRKQNAIKNYNDTRKDAKAIGFNEPAYMEVNLDNIRFARDIETLLFQFNVALSRFRLHQQAEQYWNIHKDEHDKIVAQIEEISKKRTECLEQKSQEIEATLLQALGEGWEVSVSRTMFSIYYLNTASKHEHRFEISGTFNSDYDYDDELSTEEEYIQLNAYSMNWNPLKDVNADKFIRGLNILSSNVELIKKVTDLYIDMHHTIVDLTKQRSKLNQSLKNPK